MSIRLRFPDDICIGYIDSLNPLYGWLMGKTLIRTILFIDKSAIRKCDYGSFRGDILKQFSKNELYDCNLGNCGFGGEPVNFVPNSYPTVLVEFVDGSITRSKIMHFFW